MIDEKKRKYLAVVAYLFNAYQKDIEKHQEMIMTYTTEFSNSGIQPDVLLPLFQKLIRIRFGNPFLPTISELWEFIAKEGCSAENKLAKEWDEAWLEIKLAIGQIGPYRKPKWSSSEIEETVKTYGWINLCNLDDANSTSIYAQVRDIFYSISNRKKKSYEYLIRGIEGVNKHSQQIISNSNLEKLIKSDIKNNIALLIANKEKENNKKEEITHCASCLIVKRNDPDWLCNHRGEKFNYTTATWQECEYCK